MPIPDSGAPGRSPAFALPALALLTVFAAALGVAATLVVGIPGEADGGGGLASALALETLPTTVAGIEWSGRAVFPSAVRAAGLSQQTLVTVAFLGLGAVVALLGLLGLWSEESVERRPEMALRRAVGASRRRLLRERLAETLVLVALAGGLGVLLTVVAREAVGATWSGPLRTSLAGALGPAAAAVLAACALATLLRGLAFSVEMAPGGVLNAEAPLTGADAARKPAHPLLAVAQVALVAAVLSAALALLGGIESSGRAGVGGDGERFHRLVAEHSGDGEAAEGTARSDLGSLLAAVRGLPGVEAAAFASGGAVLGLGVTDHALTQCGRCSVGGLPMPMKGGPVVHHLATADTFRALGLALLDGRAFRAGDGPGGEPVAVVSRSFALANFEGGNPLGRGIKVGESLDRWYTVVGVVEDAARWAVGAAEQPAGEVYLSARQHAVEGGELLVAGAADPGAVIRVAAGEGWTAADAGPLDAFLERSRGRVTWFGAAWIVVTAATLALAVFGVFSTMRLRVRREIREVGIRRAVGARRIRILGHYLGVGVKLGGAGVTLGVWLALFALPHLPALPDPDAALAGRALAGIVLPLLLATVAGALVPAWRASRAAPHAAIEGLVRS